MEDEQPKSDDCATEECKWAAANDAKLMERPKSRCSRLSFKGLKATLGQEPPSPLAVDQQRHANGAADLGAGGEGELEVANNTQHNPIMLKFSKYKNKQGKEGLWKTLRMKLGRGRRKCRDSCEATAQTAEESGSTSATRENNCTNQQQQSPPSPTMCNVTSPFKLTRKITTTSDEEGVDEKEPDEGLEEDVQQEPADTDLSEDGYAMHGNNATLPNSAGSELLPGMENGTSENSNDVQDDLANMQSNNTTSDVPRSLLFPFEKEFACRMPAELCMYETPKIRSLTKELFKLSKHGWYWGPITRMEAEEKLVDQPNGAFLVRDSSDDRHLLSLSFRSYGKTLHTRIEHCNGRFSFYAQPEPEGHTSIVELIDHSMNYSQSGVFCYSRARTPGSPSFPVRLTKPVSRFTQVRSLQYLCRFIIRQYTRFDHIQKLPLPSRIKGYIEEGHY